MFCSKCGQALNENAVFCPNCGTKVGGECKNQTVVKIPRKKFPVKLVAGGAVVLLLLAGGFLGVKGILSVIDGAEKNDLDKDLEETLESPEMENLWEEAEKITEPSRKTQTDSESVNETEGDQDDAKAQAQEEIDPDYMNPEIARAFGLTKEEVIELLGEPDKFYDKEGAFPCEMIYGDIDYMMVGESETINEICGPLRQLFNSNKDSINTLDDIITLTGAEGMVEYYVDEGLGDWNYGIGVLVARSYTGPYSFEMSYSPDREVTSDQKVTIVYDENSPQTPIFGERLTGEAVEQHVTEIRKRYNNIVQNCNAQNEQSKDVEMSGVTCHVTANLDDQGQVMRVSYQMEGNRFWLYYDAFSHLEFAYLERADGSAERWYFSQDKAFRIRTSADADKPDESYNYENDELIDLLQQYKEEKNVDWDVSWMELGAQMRQLFVK